MEHWIEVIFGLDIVEELASDTGYFVTRTKPQVTATKTLNVFYLFSLISRLIYLFLSSNKFSDNGMYVFCFSYVFFRVPIELIVIMICNKQFIFLRASYLKR